MRDPWETFADRRDDLHRTDVYTLRRIVPSDRGLTWGGSDAWRRDRWLRPDRSKTIGRAPGCTAHRMRGYRSDREASRVQRCDCHCGLARGDRSAGRRYRRGRDYQQAARGDFALCDRSRKHVLVEKPATGSIAELATPSSRLQRGESRCGWVSTTAITRRCKSRGSCLSGALEN